MASSPTGTPAGAEPAPLAATAEPGSTAHERDVATKTVAGMAWTMSMSWSIRGIQLLGTLAITRFLAPQVLGEVGNAAILTISADRFTRIGITQYLVTRPQKPSRELAWHATMILAGTGLLALAVVLLLTHPLARVLQSPTLGRYLPGLALAAMMTRLGVIPERLLQSQLRFRSVSTARGASELAYTATALGLAATGAGGISIVLANVARSAVYLILMTRQLSWREWLTPQPYSPAITRSIVAFGLPMSVAAICTYAAGNWDNLLVSSLFGTAVVGAYNLAYTLASIPAEQIGEQIGDVLTPSLTRLEPEQRRRALLRWLAVVSTVVFPVAVGLGAIAPTLVATILRPQWAAVGPMLAILSCIGVLRSVNVTITSYLQSARRANTLMWVSVVTVTVLFSAMALLGHFFGPLWACVGVGVGFAASGLAQGWVLVRTVQVRWLELGRACAPPLLACVPMAAAVLAVRAASAWWGLSSPGLGLALEVLAGAVGYVVAVHVVARDTVEELRELVGDAWRGRSGARKAA